MPAAASRSTPTTGVVTVADGAARPRSGGASLRHHGAGDLGRRLDRDPELHDRHQRRRRVRRHGAGRHQRGGQRGQRERRRRHGGRDHGARPSDADATTNAVTYSLDDNAGGRFAIDADDRRGDGRRRHADRPRGGAPSHDITVPATSADGSTATQTLHDRVNDVDEFDVTAPVDTNAAANAVARTPRSARRSGVTAFASDADATTNAVTYTLTDNAGGRFAIDADDRRGDGGRRRDRPRGGALSTTSRCGRPRPTARPRRRPSRSRSTTSTSSTLRRRSTATRRPTRSTRTPPIGTAGRHHGVGHRRRRHHQRGDLLADDNAGGRFAIDATTGVVTVAGGDRPRGGRPAATITVRATSADGSTARRRPSRIAINDVDEFDVTAPVDSERGGQRRSTRTPRSARRSAITAFASDADATDQRGDLLAERQRRRRCSPIDATTGVVTVAGRDRPRGGRPSAATSR